MIRLFTVIAPRAVVAMTAAGAGFGYQSSIVDATSVGDVLVSESAAQVMDHVPEVPKGIEPIMVDGLPARCAYPARDPSRITTHYWHHTATDTTATFEALARGHVNRGWCAIGYTGAIRTDGRWYIFHPLDRITNHTGGHNTAGVATVLVGNFDAYPVPPRMLTTAKRVREYYRSRGITREAMHRDVRPTACPGRYAVDVLR